MPLQATDSPKSLGQPGFPLPGGRRADSDDAAPIAGKTSFTPLGAHHAPPPDDDSDDTAGHTSGDSGPRVNPNVAADMLRAATAKPPPHNGG